MQGTRTRTWTHTTPPWQRPASVAPAGIPRFRAAVSGLGLVVRQSARLSFRVEGQRRNVTFLGAATS
ncbi:hypothetical protein GCM10010278_80520 [Streptomyces melanogenes]|nr:hypothetical protein GCM10010278_80520 [Streptomyces melanogenes]